MLFKIKISQPAFNKQNNKSTCQSHEDSLNLGNTRASHGQGLDDVVRTDVVGDHDVHVKTVIKAGGSESPVNHVNLEYFGHVTRLPLLEPDLLPVGPDHEDDGQHHQGGGHAGPHQQREHQRHLEIISNRIQNNP